MSAHQPECNWQRTGSDQCEYRDTHHYCPHPAHACDCKPRDRSELLAMAAYEAFCLGKADPGPTWNDLSPEQRADWRAVADAVRIMLDLSSHGQEPPVSP